MFIHKKTSGRGVPVSISSREILPEHFSVLPGNGENRESFA